MAAESSTIAKPVSIQTRITMSRKLFQGFSSSQNGGLETPRCLTIELSRPVWFCW